MALRSLGTIALLKLQLQIVSISIINHQFEIWAYFSIYSWPLSSIISELDR